MWPHAILFDAPARPQHWKMLHLPNGVIAQKSNAMYSDWTVVRNRRQQTLLRGHKLWFLMINRYKRNCNFTLGQCLLPALALAIIMSVLSPQKLRTQQKSEHDTAVSELTHDCDHASTCPTWEHQDSVLFSMGIQCLNNPRHNNHNQTNRCHSFIQLLLLLSGQIIANPTQCHILAMFAANQSSIIRKWKCKITDGLPELSTTQSYQRALRIMTNSRYNAHTEPLFKQLYLLKVKDIFDVQCMQFWYKFVNKKLPNYFRDMFKYNHEVHDIGTRSHDQLHLYPTRTSGARSVLRHHIPELLNTFPKYLIDKIKTHSLYSISHHIKCYLVEIYSYDCSIIDCYICNNIWKWQVAEVETLVLRATVIADRSLGSRNGNSVGGRRLLSGRWLLRFSKDTNGSITLRSISTSEWIMTLFAMASLIEFVPLLSLCILDPVRELTHYFRWLNARETYPQCTEAASLVSFALSHPFVICHKLNMTLYCASITTVHAFPFRVASMPAVRYDLSGGLPTCLWLFIYQHYSVICISKKLM